HGPLCRVSDTYKMLERWARSRGLSHETQPAIGVCPDHSAFTPQDRCLYDAGLLVPDDVDEDDVISIQTIPAGIHATLGLACKPQQMDGVWEWFTSRWLPTSGKLREIAPSYEYYPAAGCETITPEHGVELCIRLSDLRCQSVCTEFDEN
ncbi:MAG: GyrI-like domain-containing protein, partial [Hyphomicrobiaceae bacterium]